MPGKGSTAGRLSHQQLDSPAWAPQWKGAPQREQRSGFSGVVAKA
jgi:hypothetical protein